uniref:Olfactory receptor n=1 Tax=Canis lupus familiaris TaxID=9615 RepID=A0A8I3S2X8_CANLF
MDGANHSVVSEFVFLGLTNSWEIQLLLFVFSSTFYMASMMGNSLIMLTVTSDLHSPMYFLLANLSFIDLGVSSVTSPKMIYDLSEKIQIPRPVTSQKTVALLKSSYVIGGVEMVLLIAMAFDRYVAVRKPLHYLTIMSPRMCIFFLVAAWMTGLIHSMVQLAFVVNLPFCRRQTAAPPRDPPFCGPNVLDSFYCDLPWFIRLACTETYRLEFMVIKHSSAGSSKSLSTLSAHITVVFLFFSPLIFVYMWPFPSIHLDKFLAIFDAVLTPFLNPVIYTFRNQEMKVAMRRVCRQLVNYRKIS